ncbi:response regulator transcription factor [Cellulosilyticum sp. I15G10I2]|uniref:response regulator transcription factor n=1 Tax=Cellulosilyticum sp. I15G10I2 TaxID=1892843 RepID=UPI00085CDCEF|nr:response regulator [Cellulosilyticum sp. I15G10I2]
MLNVMIVDDEAIIRRGIATMMPWDKAGQIQVSTAASADEALILASTQAPDILLTDICMLEMDGLKLTEEMQKINKNVKVIILTGYDNFQYAQKACTLGVKDFVLKPIDEERLWDILLKQIEEIQKERQEYTDRRKKNRIEGFSQQIKLEEALKDCIHCRGNASSAAYINEYIHLAESTNMQVVVFIPNKADQNAWEEHKALLHWSIKSLCIEMIDANTYGITFEDDLGRIVVLLTDENNINEAIEVAEKVNDIIFNEYSIQYKIYFGAQIQDINELPKSYEQALSVLESDKNAAQKSARQQDIPKKNQPIQEVVGDIKKLLIDQLDDYAEVNGLLQQLAGAFKRHGVSDRLMRRSCFEIGCDIYWVYYEQTNHFHKEILDELMVTLISCDIKDVISYVEKFIVQLIQQDRQKLHEIIEEACKYIDQQLNEDLSVTKLAEKFYVSPNYFSRLFKRETGKGCNEYIVSKRIERAKMLLISKDYKIARIAAMVGYNDVNYFSLAFKKHTGKSPTEFKE